ncbi:symmetrical bis(5'-nucleosyl)-tetraphosphatase [Shewanella intestini]|uniref:Bis(5'-nucleosyl)-tetraphosphatase, symmetrical n=1 Tax=Shewanella intestini TaxID=2017544 RepID=A0ABS5HXI4_9GAMM|nr:MULTISPECIES: symmetrical bis(5'-nucleosyl)-tetraphosphatase [Shewanella]MBR9726406.1 symmetrical bis(5'-nucleosyl)-tetraphosphatase [Shewanella intestini]MRG35028.1 symmetrical bis(5'-nucleosyl)-tetraphosphatase [Shewanella sp. XMDDZSB0408]
MAHYFVGDVQGCFAELQALLAKVAFNPSKDELWAVGDLVARGENSLATLQFFKQLDNSAKVVLGNHDLHLLALHGKLKRPNPKDNLAELLASPDINQLTGWLRHQPLMRYLPSHNIVMTHAGVPPHWDLNTLQTESALVSEALIKPNYLDALISKMYTEAPEPWQPNATGVPRLRYCINALTRMRFLDLHGQLDFACKSSPFDVDKTQLIPWFEFPSALAPDITIAFGHWAALKGQVSRPFLQALDTGCCWGEEMTLWHLETDQKITQKKLNFR